MAEVSVPRVLATEAALALIARLQAAHGPLAFHQSGGCCDGSAPLCLAADELVVGAQDRRLGTLGGAPFFVSGAQFSYWQHSQLLIDAVPGRASGFSLEGGTGLHFVTRSRLFTEAEASWLQAQEPDGPPGGAGT